MKISDEARAALDQLAAEKPWRLEYHRVGGRGTGVGVSVGSKLFASRELAERHQAQMMREDERRGHITDYSITNREESDR